MKPSTRANKTRREVEREKLTVDFLLPYKSRRILVAKAKKSFRLLLISFLLFGFFVTLLFSFSVPSRLF